MAGLDPAIYDSLPLDANDVDGRGKPGHDDNQKRRYFFALRFDFFAVFFPAGLRFFAACFGTFLPSARASDSPIAIACLRLVTFFLERPLRRVPAFRFFISRSTSRGALF